MSLRLTITFRGPFAVSTGRSRAGVDLVVDEEQPLPPTALKGLLRAELLESLHITPEHVESIFGTAARDAGWRWAEPAFTAQGGRHPRTRITQTSRIKTTDTGAPERGFLAFTEVTWENSAEVILEPVGRDAAHDRDQERLLLRAAARSVSSLGSHRKRGKGWVRIVDVDADGAEIRWTEHDSQRLLALMDGDVDA